MPIEYVLVQVGAIAYTCRFEQNHVLVKKKLAFLTHFLSTPDGGHLHTTGILLFNFEI